MILAYEIIPYDGGAHFFEDKRMPVLCPSCTSLIVKDFLPTNVKPQKKWDICSSYDNRAIVNERFKAWCDGQGFGGIGFRKVNANPAYFVFEPTTVLRLDPRCARFSEKCPDCGNFRFGKRLGPLRLLEVSSPIMHGFFRTDLEYGSGREQSPCIIVGIETMQLLKRERFRLFDIKPVLERLAV